MKNKNISYSLNTDGFSALVLLPKSLICIGIVLISMAVVLFMKNRIQPSWVSTTGMITDSAMESYQVVPSTDSNPSTTFYYSNITVEYTGSDQSYSKSMSIGDVAANDPSMVETTLKQFPKGQVVTVFFDPSNPESSLIKTDANLFPWAKVAIGIILMLTGFLPVSVYGSIARSVLPESMTQEKEKKVTQSIKKQGNRPTTVNEQEIKKPLPEFTGNWKLEYQIPTMGEMMAYSVSPAKTSSFDMNSLMMPGKDSTTVSITGNDITFKYAESSGSGSCEMVSSYRLKGDTLILEHERMDFLMTEIEDFPPTHYTYRLKGKNLVLTSNEIKGIGNKKIVYQLSRS